MCDWMSNSMSSATSYFDHCDQVCLRCPTCPVPLRPSSYNARPIHHHHSMCPNELNLPFLIAKLTGSNPDNSPSSALFFLTFSVNYYWFSVVSNFVSWSTCVSQVLLLYISDKLYIHLLYMLPFWDSICYWDSGYVSWHGHRAGTRDWYFDIIQKAYYHPLLGPTQKQYSGSNACP